MFLHITQRLHWTFCTASSYCSERPQKKGRANPCVIVLYTRTIPAGGLHPGSFRLFEITFSSIIYELVATFTNTSKTLLTCKFWEGGGRSKCPPLPPSQWSPGCLNAKIWNWLMQVWKYLNIYIVDNYSQSLPSFFFLQTTQRLHKIEHVNTNYRNYLGTAYQVNAISVVSIVTGL